jgi:hypothetical protein
MNVTGKTMLCDALCVFWVAASDLRIPDTTTRPRSTGAFGRYLYSR